MESRRRFGGVDLGREYSTSSDNTAYMRSILYKQNFGPVQKRRESQRETQLSVVGVVGGGQKKNQPGKLTYVGNWY
jgi:hypothetical protein